MLGRATANDRLFSEDHTCLTLHPSARNAPQPPASTPTSSLGVDVISSRRLLTLQLHQSPPLG